MKIIPTAEFFDRSTKNLIIYFYNTCKISVNILVFPLYMVVTMHKRYVKRYLEISSFQLYYFCNSDHCIYSFTLKSYHICQKQLFYAVLNLGNSWFLNSGILNFVFKRKNLLRNFNFVAPLKRNFIL